MVQMNAMGTKITEAYNLQPEIDLMTDALEERTKTHNEDPLPGSKQEILWNNVVRLILLHVLAVISVITCPTTMKYQTIIWVFLVGGIGGFGVTGGVHRYYTHRSFKAKIPLQIILLACYTVSGQNSVPTWVRDHLVHHKFSDTDADPHNAKRGFFFSHVGWLMQRKHPEVHRRGRTVDMSYINNDPLVQFHTKHFMLLKLLLCFFIPVIVPVYAWNETWMIAFAMNIFRYVLNLNFTWSVNSFAHIWGTKPFDKRIQPAQNLAVSIMSMGEGWHNYHHVFPWDYRASELGEYALNLTTMWLDLFARMGWAYDLKTPSEELVRQVAVKHGDGTWKQHERSEV